MRTSESSLFLETDPWGSPCHRLESNERSASMPTSQDQHERWDSPRFSPVGVMTVTFSTHSLDPGTVSTTRRDPSITASATPPAATSRTSPEGAWEAWADDPGAARRFRFSCPTFCASTSWAEAALSALTPADGSREAVNGAAGAGDFNAHGHHQGSEHVIERSGELMNSGMIMMMPVLEHAAYRAFLRCLWRRQRSFPYARGISQQLSDITSM